ncbi:MAG TPA: ATP-binding protein, partial [Chthoniobacterales bacterium]|nr:ATP-binding protein [Chthoniobacterales bacterium]
EITGAINCLYDITERKYAEQQQEALYQFVQRQSLAASVRDIYDAALEAIVLTMRCDRASILLFDHHDVMRFVAWRGLSKAYRKAVEGHSPWKRDVEDPHPVCIEHVDLARLPKPLKTTIKAEGITAAAFIPLVANGKLFGKFMAYYDQPHVFTEKEMTLAVSIARQLTLGLERKRAEEELRKSKLLLEQRVQQRTEALRAANRELQREIERRKGLEGEILEVSDREQQRLGQELHDGLCQQLAAIGFMARATALRVKDHRVVQVEDLEKIAQLVNASVSDARNIARDLHKEEVDAAGFVEALRSLTQREMWKTRCRFELKTDVHLEDDRTASQLYRILREALINAHKHAQASQIVLEVRQMKTNLVFSVTDNGVGFSRKTKTGRGLGFHIMQYRARSVGARLKLESPAKRGARVVCYLPHPNDAR